MEFSTVEESEQGSSATDSLSSDVTDGWKMEDGRWKMEDGRWKMEDGRWKMEDGRWKMEDGRWKEQDGRWKMEGAFLKLAMPNALRPNYQFPMINNQFPKQIGGALRPPY
ncbi:hypothetical protein QUB08_27755 [Microcoleus sp. BR0-C5]|uniref:hypothetical protein n=1 Tax=Microcoleus sp. BR0-C5 TaxID=2818713 RepID=UPI002FD192D0